MKLTALVRLSQVALALLAVCVLGCSVDQTRSSTSGSEGATSVLLPQDVEFVMTLAADLPDRRGVLEKLLEDLETEVNGPEGNGEEFEGGMCGLDLDGRDRQIVVRAQHGSWTWKGFWRMNVRVISDDGWLDGGGEVRFVGTHVYGPPDAVSQLYDAEDAGNLIRKRLSTALDTAVAASGGNVTRKR